MGVTFGSFDHWGALLGGGGFWARRGTRGTRGGEEDTREGIEQGSSGGYLGGACWDGVGAWGWHFLEIEEGGGWDFITLRN